MSQRQLDKAQTRKRYVRLKHKVTCPCCITPDRRTFKRVTKRARRIEDRIVTEEALSEVS
jgi:hypothetical protein